MNIKTIFPDYALIDTGDGEKLERFGSYTLRRPEPQAIWRKSLTEQQWQAAADASFMRDSRSEERGEWRLKPNMPSRWTVKYDYKDMHLKMRLGLTSFKHVGIFPEQAANWNFIYDTCRAKLEQKGAKPKVLNLFAYTGGATLAAAASGAEVTHVDSVKQVVTWSRENMESSNLDSIRWIVEDALKFVQREVRRGNRYDGIILDPPAFAKHHKVLGNAMQGYKRLNARALSQIKSGGILFTFSCSQAVSKELFRTTVFTAAAIAGRKVRILHQLTQPTDHPINIYHPEGEYLKGLVLYVE